MKIIKEKLGKCKECPYVVAEGRYEKHTNYKCNHEEIPGLRKIYIAEEDIPKWCPLPGDIFSVGYQTEWSDKLEKGFKLMEDIADDLTVKKIYDEEIKVQNKRLIEVLEKIKKMNKDFINRKEINGMIDNIIEEDIKDNGDN